jgi:hypothetical protein
MEITNTFTQIYIEVSRLESLRRLRHKIDTIEKEQNGDFNSRRLICRTRALARPS